jgi:arginine-tRNA-protein transferase
MIRPGQLRTVDLYRTPAHPCPYLPGRQAVNLFVDPSAALDPATYELLLMRGFRRSGDHVYRPGCPACRRCVPARIPVGAFRPKRSQRRVWAANAGRIRALAREPELDPEHFELFHRYLAARHRDGGMSEAGIEDYLGFLTAGWSDTRFVELRDGDHLMAVAVTDHLPRALSSVYTFFDPRDAHRSPGVYSILWQIAEAKALGKHWLYLGYWIPGCRKMDYKAEYRPVELRGTQGWRRIDRGESPGLPEADPPDRLATDRPPG